MEASRWRMRVSHVAQERLAASFGITEGAGTLAEVPASETVEKRKKHHCRLSMDSLIWDSLAQEAMKRGVSVTEMVRQRLREAMLGEVPERRWSTPAESAGGRPARDVLDDGRLEYPHSGCGARRPHPACRAGHPTHLAESSAVGWVPVAARRREG